VEETLLKATARQAGYNEHLTGHLISIRAYYSALQGDMPRATILAQEAMERLPDRDLAARSWTASLLANALRWSGDLSAADQVFTNANVISQAAGYSHVAVDVLCDWAGLQIMQGQLRKAASTCQDALLLADESVSRTGRRLPITGYVYARLSAVLRQRNDLEAALHHARESVRLCEEWGWAEVLVGSFVSLAEALQAIGETDSALDVAQKARQQALGVSPWFEAYSAALEARLRLVQGDVAAAHRWASEQGQLTLGDKPNFHYEFAYLTLARIRIAQSRLNEALRLLALLLKRAEEAEAFGYEIEIQVLIATALHARKKDDEALRSLERALTLAEPEGYVRIFIDQGEPMGELLLQAAARGIAVSYVSRLLVALEKQTKDRHRLVSAEMVEPFSERELEVMRLLTTHLSSTDIAGELAISVNTVRTHIKSIYGKLGVHSREEAVQKAEALHLL
jgi:LuxR family maltose regulon positive regulatory protein